MTPPDAPPENATSSVSYALVSSSELPAFDPAIMMKHLALSERRMNAFNRAAFRYNRLLEISYIAGYILRIVAFFAPKATGEWVVVISLLAQVPGAITVVFAFRYEFVKILARTYDFWYFLTVNLIWLWSSAVFMGDIRIVLLPLLAIELQNGSLLDAYLDNMRRIVMVAWITAAFFMTLLAAVATGVFEYKRAEMVLLASNSHSLTLTELYLNATSTILILVVRIAYRRRIAIRCPRTSASSIQCITYRTALRLQAVTTEGPTALAMPALLQRTKSPGQERRLQIRLVRMDGPFNADRLVVRVFRSWQPLSSHHRLLLYGFYLSGVLITLFPMSSTVTNSRFGALTATVSCTFTLSFCGLFFACSQRCLLLQIVTSFDFFFLSMQITLSAICMCDMFSYTWPACCGALCSWLWIHWVLLLDAVTPVMKQKLGFSIYMATLVVLLFMIVQIIVCLDILVWNHWQLENRLVAQYQFFNHQMRFYVVPFYFSRSFTIVIWCCRLLWRIWVRAHPNELIMLKGNVEYPTPPHMRKAPHRKPMNAVNPNSEFPSSNHHNDGRS